VIFSAVRFFFVTKEKRRRKEKLASFFAFRGKKKDDSVLVFDKRRFLSLSLSLALLLGEDERSLFNIRKI